MPSPGDGGKGTDANPLCSSSPGRKLLGRDKLVYWVWVKLLRWMLPPQHFLLAPVLILQGKFWALVLMIVYSTIMLAKEVFYGLSEPPCRLMR